MTLPWAACVTVSAVASRTRLQASHMRRYHKPKAYARQQVKANENALKVEIAMPNERIRQLVAELDAKDALIEELQARVK